MRDFLVRKCVLAAKNRISAAKVSRVQPTKELLQILRIWLIFDHRLNFFCHQSLYHASQPFFLTIFTLSRLRKWC